MTNHTDKDKQEHLDGWEILDKPITDDSKKNKNAIWPKVAVGLGTLVVLGGGWALYNQQSSNADTVTLNQFEDFPEREVVIMDQGILEYNEGLSKFVNEHKNKEGLHVYTDEESQDTYAFITGKEGMEPLTMMLYGVVEGKEDAVIIGYNYVEASPQFRHEVPTMLIKVEAEEDLDVLGKIVKDDDYEDYKDVLKRYKEAGFTPLSPEELERMDEEEWTKLEEKESASEPENDEDNE